MKIGIDISQIAYEGTGVGRFVNGLTRTIIDQEKTHEWVFFYSSLRRTLSSDIRSLISKSGHRIIELKLPPTALSFLWNNIHRMKIEKLTGSLDWFITSDWTEAPSRMKKATVIHDLVYLRYPDTVHPVIRQTQRERMKWVKKESRIIFADSESTKRDITELLGIDASRIHVNYPGLGEMPVREPAGDTLKRHGLDRPFVLTVGKIEPRKNIGKLIEAFSSKKRGNLQLVVVGPQGWDSAVTKHKSETKNIRFLNYVTDTELANLYASCLFFMYPSLYEGFGYPVVEAMRAGAAVATSNVSSLREIGEGAALLFDPLEMGSISKAMDELTENALLRSELKKKGIIKSGKYRWKRYYETMMRILENSVTS